jgi:hypothetical protein
MAQSWIGIRLSAALAILGSVITLLIAAALLWIAFRAEDTPNLTRAMLIVLAVFFSCLTVWGIFSGTGVLRRRPWARVSMLVFAVLLVGMGVSALVGILFVRMPQSPGLPDRPVLNIRLWIAACYAGLTLVGAWWLLLFSSAATKQYFSEPRASTAAGMPVSIDIIGWCLLLSAVATAAAATLRVPALVFGAVVTNWAALAIYTACTAAQIYLGTGLLGRQEPARLASIVYFGFLLMNFLAWVIMPGFAARTQALLENMPRILRLRVSPETTESLGGLAWIGCALAAAPIWFLVRRRKGFSGSRS